MKIQRQHLAYAVSLAAVLALSACNKTQDTTTTPAPTPTPPPAMSAPAPAPAPAATTAMSSSMTPSGLVSVSSVDVGNSIDADSKVTTAGSTFNPKDTIYASVATSGSGSATLEAKWTYQDGQTVKDDTKTINPTGPAQTEFHIMKPNGWPTGNYKVAISLNGTQASSKDFSVK